MKPLWARWVSVNKESFEADLRGFGSWFAW
jgi:hypothetical protein